MNEMRITLELQSVLDAYLPDDAPFERAMLDVDSKTTPLSLIRELGIPEHRVHLVYINGQLLDRSVWSVTGVHDGDVVTLWPLLAGG